MTLWQNFLLFQCTAPKHMFCLRFAQALGSKNTHRHGAVNSSQKLVPEYLLSQQLFFLGDSWVPHFCIQLQGRFPPGGSHLGTRALGYPSLQDSSWHADGICGIDTELSSEPKGQTCVPSTLACQSHSCAFSFGILGRRRQLIARPLLMFYTPLPL